MGRRGPVPKPTALRLIQGNLAKGKVKLNRREPQPPPAGAILDPPAWMDPQARRVFLQLRPELPWLSNADLDLLAAYCAAFSRWRQAEDAVTKNGLTYETKKGYVGQRPEISIAKNYFGQMMAAGAALGLSPAARTRIRVEEETKEEDNDKAIFG